MVDANRNALILVVFRTDPTKVDAPANEKPNKWVSDGDEERVICAGIEVKRGWWLVGWGGLIQNV
jgi:hypothetical protein